MRGVIEADGGACPAPLVLLRLVTPAGVRGPPGGLSSRRSTQRHRLQPAVRRGPQPVRPKKMNAAVGRVRRLGHVADWLHRHGLHPGGDAGPDAERLGLLRPLPRRLLPELRTGRRYTGFRADPATAPGVVVFSKDIEAKRSGRQSNLVVMSTCFSADAAKHDDAGRVRDREDEDDRPGKQGPEFYVGYIGAAGTSTSGSSSSGSGMRSAKKSVGASFDVAMLGAVQRPELRRRLVGHYHWSGRAGPWTTCPNCS